MNDKNGNFFNKVNSFLDYINNSDSSKERVNKRLEEEMDVYNLDDDEKELVREALYDPWDFSDDKEDLEEDDYHCDDVQWCV